MSADGATLLLNDVALPLGDFNLAVLDIEKRDLRTLLDLAEGVSEPSLSPDGRWLASNESGDINIRPFPDLTQSRRSIGRGMNPTFSPDGSEIFFFDGAGLSVAAVQYAPFSVGNPRQLFRGEYWYGRLAANGAAGRAWDVDPKNDRFLMITMPAAGTEVTAPSRLQVRVVLNWFEILEQRVPKR
jgi:Tol biopolymer transport system component